MRDLIKYYIWLKFDSGWDATKYHCFFSQVTIALSSQKKLFSKLLFHKFLRSFKNINILLLILLPSLSLSPLLLLLLLLLLLFLLFTKRLTFCQVIFTSLFWRDLLIDYLHLSSKTINTKKLIRMKTLVTPN